MPTHATLDPIETTTKAIDALLTAIDGASGSGAIAAYRAAIRRHGVNIIASAGPSALDRIITRIRADASDKAAADVREAILDTAWAGLPRWRS